MHTQETGLDLVTLPSKYNACCSTDVLILSTIRVPPKYHFESTGTYTHGTRLAKLKVSTQKNDSVKLILVLEITP